MHFNPTVACKYNETFEIFFQQMKNLSLILKAETELWSNIFLKFYCGEKKISDDIIMTSSVTVKLSSW